MEWISAKDRLPDSYNPVLVFRRTGLGIEYVRNAENGWQYDYLYISNPVTHWMPLPEPPDN